MKQVCKCVLQQMRDYWSIYAHSLIPQLAPNFTGGATEWETKTRHLEREQLRSEAQDTAGGWDQQVAVPDWSGSDSSWSVETLG